jgi:hypothetical protein
VYQRPDYATARAQVGFYWSVGGSQGALRQLTGTPIRDFNLDPEACIDCFRRGLPLLRDWFGEEVGLPVISTPAVSYGHPNCLGAELLFPEVGEVGHTHLYTSLDQGLAALKQPVDWPTAGLTPFYLQFREKLQAAFPGEPVRMSFGAEGPLTTAYELRGDGFFTDIFDQPAKAKEFLRLAVASALDFETFVATVHGEPLLNPPSAGMCDDIASFIPPALFPEFVLPYWEQWFSALTTGTRHAHVEDLKIEQLPYLEEIGLASFDPSISPKLTPKILTEHSRVPYGWRLGEIHFREMSAQEASDFVFQSCADGASGVITVIAEETCTDKGVAIIEAFIRAGKEAKALFDAGCSRAEIGQHVSPEGQAKLWDRWCGYNGPLSSRGGARVA